MIKQLNPLGVGLAVALAFVGAAQADSSVSGKRVTLLMVSGACDYCGKATDKVKEVLEDAGVKVTVSINDYDAAVQAQQINQAISTQPDAVVVWPADGTAIVPSLMRLKAAGIPVILENSGAATKDPTLYQTFVGPNDYAYGQAAARAMAEGFKEKGFGADGSVIVIEGVPSNAPAIDRNNGFRDELAKVAPGIKIVGTEPGNWDQTDSIKAASGLLTRFGGEVKGVYGQIDPMLAGAVIATKRAGLNPSSLVMIGSNCAIEGYNGLKSGDFYATFLQSPLEDGRMTAEAMIKLLKGEQLDRAIYMDAVEIKKDNLEKDCARFIGK